MVIHPETLHIFCLPPVSVAASRTVLITLYYGKGGLTTHMGFPSKMVPSSSDMRPMVAVFHTASLSLWTMLPLALYSCKSTNEIAVRALNTLDRGELKKNMEGCSLHFLFSSCFCFAAVTLRLPSLWHCSPGSWKFVSLKLSFAASYRGEGSINDKIQHLHYNSSR